MSNQTFSFGIVVESDRELEAALLEHDYDEWIDYKALDNAMYFQLGKFNMGERRYRAKFYGNTHVFVQVERGFAPCGWFSIQRIRKELA